MHPIRIAGGVLLEYVARAMEMVTSADKAYKILPEVFGVYAPRRAVREAWKTWGEKTAYRAVIRQWPKEKPIPKAWIMERGQKGKAPYLAIGEYTIYDVEGKPVEKGQVSAYFRKKPTLGEMLEAFEAYEGQSPILKPGETVEYDFYALQRMEV